MGAAVGAVKITSLSGALTVTWTGPGGATPKVYTTATLTTQISLPATVSDGTATTFYFASPGVYTLSVKDTNSTELAATGNTTRNVDIESAGTIQAFSYDTRLYAQVAGDSGSSQASSSGGSSTPPTSPVTNQLWYDSNAELWKRWNGSAWVAEGYAAYVALGSGATRVIDLAAQYGADPTGATDSTSQIMAALAALDASGGGTLRVNGRFLYSDIQYQTGSPIAVVGATPFSGFRSSLGKSPSITQGIFWLHAGTAGIALTVEDLVFDYTTGVVVDADAGSRTNGIGDVRIGGVNGTIAGDVTAKNVRVVDGRNFGIWVEYANRARVLQPTVVTNLGGGVIVFNCTDSMIDDYFITDLGDDGIQVSADPNLAAGSQRFSVGKGTVYKSYGAAVDLTGGVYGHVIGLISDTTYYSGVLVQDFSGDVDTSHVIVDDVVIKDAGQYYGAGQFKTAIGGNIDGIKVLGGVADVQVGTRRLIVNPAGVPVNVATGTGGFPVATRVDSGGTGRRTVTGDILRADCPINIGAWPAVNVMTWHKIEFAHQATISAINVNVTTAATGGTAVLHMAIASDNGNCAPGGQVLWEGNTTSDATTAGVKSAAPALSVKAGTYWVGCCWQGTATGAPQGYYLSGHMPGMPAADAAGDNSNGWVTTGVSANVPNPVVLNGGVTSSAMCLTTSI